MSTVLLAMYNQVQTGHVKLAIVIISMQMQELIRLTLRNPNLEKLVSVQFRKSVKRKKRIRVSYGK